jgi:hypothetical protein
MTESRIAGNCSCGRPVIKVLNSAVPTMWRDGTRYAYPESIDTDTGCIFRCRTCLQPIADNFSAASPVPELETK